MSEMQAAHNYQLYKTNAAVCMTNYRITGKHFYLVDAIYYTRRALNLMRYIMKRGEYAIHSESGGVR